LAETVELFQRRHIIIHNAGRVSKRYITKVSEFERNPPSIGTELPPDAEYVQGALDNLNVAGFLLTAFVHRNLTGRPSKSPIVGQIWRRAGYLIRLERWRACKKLCAVSKFFKEATESFRLTMQCEEWLCIKKLDGLDAIRAEVESWDASALGHRFRAMKHVLLDEDDKARAALKLAIESGELTRYSLSELPFLERLQALPQADDADSS
jgi:hypothetical protein